MVHGFWGTIGVVIALLTMFVGLPLLVALIVWLYRIWYVRTTDRRCGRSHPGDSCVLPHRHFAKTHAGPWNRRMNTGELARRRWTDYSFGGVASFYETWAEANPGKPSPVSPIFHRPQ